MYINLYEISSTDKIIILSKSMILFNKDITELQIHNKNYMKFVINIIK